MPKVSVNILTKDRSALLREALDSVMTQTFTDYEVIAVNDGSTDDTAAVLEDYKNKLPLTVIVHKTSQGIIKSRQEALAASRGELVALLDDDDVWLDKQKLANQVAWFGENHQGVLVGSAVEYRMETRNEIVSRAETDYKIRQTMLLRNNFFTSTVMFKKAAALAAGGFIDDGIGVAEDYDLWLRLGKLGQIANFRGVFTAYRAPVYTKARFKSFLSKQWVLIKRHKGDYPYYWLSAAILRFRLIFNF